MGLKVIWCNVQHFLVWTAGSIQIGHGPYTVWLHLVEISLISYFSCEFIQLSQNYMHANCMLACLARFDLSSDDR